MSRKIDRLLAQIKNLFSRRKQMPGEPKLPNFDKQNKHIRDTNSGIPPLYSGDSYEQAEKKAETLDNPIINKNLNENEISKLLKLLEEQTLAGVEIGKLIHLLEETKKISREFYKSNTNIQENTTATKELYDSLQQNKSEVEQLKKVIDQMLIQQRQENGELRRKINEWEQITVEFFQLLERAIDTEKDENKALVKKIINEFDRLVKVQGIDRIIPQPNETLMEKLHEGVGVEESSDIVEGNILRCTQWGYRSGYNVIEKAKVVVAKQQNFSSEIIVKPKEEEVVSAQNNELLDSEKTEKDRSLETQNEQTDSIQEETIRAEFSLADSLRTIDTNLNENREADILNENNPELKSIDDYQKSEDG